MSRRQSLSVFVFALWMAVLPACNNPFGTRTPEVPPAGGAAILPPTSPEKVIHNLEEAVQAKSIQDYLDVFSDDFIFSPDPGDSLAYEQDFRGRWTKEREGDFAINFFQQAQQDSTFAVLLYPYSPSVYHPGERMYVYYYRMAFGVSGGKETVIRGYAWFYFRESAEGKWSIFLWVDHRSLPPNEATTWGVLRALYG